MQLLKLLLKYDNIVKCLFNQYSSTIVLNYIYILFYIYNIFNYFKYLCKVLNIHHVTSCNIKKRVI